MIPTKDKIKGAKPLMADKVCSFFRVGTPKSIGDSMIFSIVTEVKKAGILIPGVTLQRPSYKYSF